MSKNKQRISLSEYTPSEYQDIPKAILYAVELMLKASPRNDIELDMRNRYRVLDEQKLDGQSVEVGIIGKVKPLLSKQFSRQCLRLITKTSNYEFFDSQRFDLDRNKWLPVKFNLTSPELPGYITYVSKDTVNNLREPETKTIAGTCDSIISTKVGASVSLITSGGSVSATEEAMMTATEMAQNRTWVSSITLDTKEQLDDQLALMPYQESWANGMGNILGSIAVGWTYAKYRNYMIGPYRKVPLHATQLQGKFFKKGQTIIAPHFMFNEKFYDQIAAGQLPEAKPEIISVASD